MLNRNVRCLTITLAVLASASLFSPTTTFADEEAVARQARIDAAEAENNINQLDQTANQDAAIDGLDSPGAQAAEAQIGQQDEALQNAQQREMMADQELARSGN